MHQVPAPNITANRLVLLGFEACEVAVELVLQLSHTYHFAEGADGTQFLADGFSEPESWGTWTTAKNPSSSPSVRRPRRRSPSSSRPILCPPNRTESRWRLSSPTVMLAG